MRALDTQLKAAEKEFHEIKGAMSQSEGLHQKRTAAAARVEELTRQTEREALESEAYDRLYALFEECRERQLGSVMGPIHDRVLRWMRLLRIGGYQSIRFNDQLLPEKLVAGDGATEWMLGEESTGTIEQIAMMVRLALGSMLSTPDDPAVAVLDDPLTHSDVVRLDRMRAVLKSASAGDLDSTPPAGPSADYRTDLSSRMVRNRRCEDRQSLSTGRVEQTLLIPSSAALLYNHDQILQNLLDSRFSPGMVVIGAASRAAPSPAPPFPAHPPNCPPEINPCPTSAEPKRFPPAADCAARPSFNR